MCFEMEFPRLQIWGPHTLNMWLYMNCYAGATRFGLESTPMWKPPCGDASGTINNFHLTKKMTGNTIT